jgi:hypothetical protein
MTSLKDIQQWRASEPVIPRYLATGPFELAKRFAAEYDCDLAVPNGSGVGNVLCFTPLVDAFARRLGRRIRLLTAPLHTLVEPDHSPCLYPIWEHNPYIHEIVNADEIDTEIMRAVRSEQNNIGHFGHFIENVCRVYRLAPRALRPSLFLSAADQAMALDKLASLPRPVVCIHAGGTSSPTADSPWFLQRWLDLIAEVSGCVSFVQVGKQGFDQKDLGIFRPAMDLRQLIALIWACDMFVGFDSAPAHIATAFGRPATVLWDVRRKSIVEDRHYLGFGPASMLRWSYPQNRNLMIMGEKDDELVPLCVEFVRGCAASFDHQR